MSEKESHTPIYSPSSNTTNAWTTCRELSRRRSRLQSQFVWNNEKSDVDLVERGRGDEPGSEKDRIGRRIRGRSVVEESEEGVEAHEQLLAQLQRLFHQLPELLVAPIRVREVLAQADLGSTCIVSKPGRDSAAP